jgi:hypothetical protein
MNSTGLCSLVGRYDNPVPIRFLAPKDCLNIPAQATQPDGIGSLELILGLLLSLKIRGSEPVFLNLYGARNRFQGMNSASLCSLAGRYDNPIPPRFLAHIDCLKIPAQSTRLSL